MKTLNLKLLVVVCAALQVLCVSDLPAQVSTGLIAYYPFSGNASDASGNGHDATVFGATLCPDRLGEPNRAYAFNGNGQRIVIPASSAFELRTQISITAWVRRNQTGVLSPILCKDDHQPNGSSHFEFTVQANDRLTLNYWAPGWVRSESTSLIADTLWHHVAATFNGQVVALYVDGVFAGATPQTTPMWAQNEPLQIGEAQASGFAYLDGQVDEVRIYNRALSETEVEELFQTGGGPAGNLAPVATPQQVTVAAGGSVPVTLLAVDPNGDPLTYRISAAPTHGVLTGSPASLTYTPAAGYVGVDSFTFVANDGQLDSEPATINIAVAIFDENDGRRIGVAAFFCTGMAVGDLDGDGDIDLVLICNYWGDYIALNDGTGHFTLQGLGQVGYRPGQTVVCDFDLDGDLDIFSVGVAYLNDGRANFTFEPTLAHGGRAVAMGDLNGDGYPDMIIGSDPWPGGVYMNNQQGGFTPLAQQVSFGSQEHGMALADVDNDGDLDCAIAGAIYLNDGSGNFTFGQDVPLPGWSGGRVFADLNKDGWLDLVVAAGLIMLNDGTGHLVATSQNLGWNYNIAVGDVDADGDPDIVTSNPAQVFLGDGMGSFTGPVQAIPNGGAPNDSVVLADMDGNGSLDLVVSSNPGGFPTPEAYPNLVPLLLPDIIPPTITCPANIVKTTNPGQCSAVVDFSVSATDDSGSVTVACNPPSGSVFPKGSTTVNCTATDAAGNTAICSFTVAVQDWKPPAIVCPADIMLPCSVDLLEPASYSASAQDNCTAQPAVTFSPPSGSGFPVGLTTVTATATDGAGNTSICAFKVTRAPLGFSGFLPPIGGADETGGSFAEPVRTLKLGSTIPVKFTTFCEGTPISTGIHRLQVIKYSDATNSDEPIDASPQDTATTGNQFQYRDGRWHFILDTKASGMTKGIWLLVATLSDGSQHRAWIQVK